MLHRLNQNEGFTLVELLVVILVIGILAAIALPVFTNEQRRGQDASAKSNARNASTQMETCFATTQTYVGCALGSGLPVSAGAGQVRITGTPTATDYVITARSNSGCSFILTKSATGAVGTTSGGTCPAPTW